MDQNKFESLLRRYTVEKLQVFQAVITSTTQAVTSGTVSSMTGISAKELGGVLSSLSRSKIEAEPVILPVARSRDQGMIWKYNERILSRNEASHVIDKILKEVNSYYPTV